MLMPKRVKYRKQHRGRMKGKATRGNRVVFGDYGIQALAPAWITSEQIEAVRRTLTRHAGKNGRVWIRIFPDKSVTARPAESRMGGGKGDVKEWVAVVKPGTILFEIAGIPKEEAMEAIRIAGRKLPIETRFVTREIGGE
ncbi:MAG TPA: 50S ribosomal protein L16 [Dictyoglomaceae bacterium]|nr:50S ribosomal protein L16 [Dictyoglomaceae bacterium]HOL38830.1 50S ribosomal protein L16 [Dictyoglomaceae bacterium]HOP94466.1 50S ribosomal protein L16 [Dictyoglomaceae bacterium]HPP15422.1 50S ribosomal protein L16 [Dictyoglomaceae bacterium]HPU43198.1 50S ribosomal protein L16 [Dictyoglomaceae bacterium]